MKAQDMRSAKILVVNGRKPETTQVHQWLAGEGYSHIKLTRTAHEVLTCYVAFDPDVVLLDLQIGHVEGALLLERLHSVTSQDGPIPILALTDRIPEGELKLAASAGAHAFITRPFTRTELLINVGNAAELRFLRKLKAGDASEFESLLAERTKE